MTQRRTIGVGLISNGWMGRLHSRSLRQLADRYPELGVDIRLVIAADPVESAQADAINRLGYETATADYHDVINHPDVDVISICSPNFLHREVALATISAGKNFWIEKPMGRSAAESRDIALAAAAQGLMTAVGFNYRHAPAVAHARELIRSGALGTITNVRGSLFADYSSDPKGAFTWRFERAQSGTGVLGDLMSHGFDLAQYLLGPISEVSALTATFISERREAGSSNASHFSASADGPIRQVENEDYAGILTRFESGAVGIFDSSRVAIGPRAEYTIEVYGTEGSLRWDFERMNELEVCLGRKAGEYGYTTVFASPGHGDFAAFQPGGGIAMGYDDLKAIEAKLFIESVLSGIQKAPSVADAWSAAAVIDACVVSAESKKWEQVAQPAEGTTHAH
jgi:predicted dehydrogenase